MAFGQSSGPPATGKQVNELLELLEAAGHSDFRDARGPMGFSQRQAGGKFSRDEADGFIEQLQSEIYGDGPPAGSTPPATTRTARPGRSERKVTQKSTKIARRTPAKGSAPAKGSWRSNLPTAPAAVETAQAAAKAVPADVEPISADLGEIPADLLAAELQRRGWTVTEP